MTEPAAARTLAGRLDRAWTSGADDDWEAALRAYERVIDEDRLLREHGDAATALAEFDRRFGAFVRGGETMAARVDELAALLDLACAPPDAAEPTATLTKPREDYIALRSRLRAWEASARRALLGAIEVYRLLPPPERYAAGARWGPLVDDRGLYPCWRRRIPVDRLDVLDWRAAWLDAGSPYWPVRDRRQYHEIAGMFCRVQTPEAWRTARETARARGLDERRWGRWEDKARDRLRDTGAWPRGTWPGAQTTFDVSEPAPPGPAAPMREG